MRHYVSYAFLVLPLPSLHAQDQSSRPTTNCPAAEAALGPESSAQAKAPLRRDYSAQTDRTYIHTITDVFLGATGFSALVSWPGQGSPESISAQLDVSVPKDLVASPVTAADTLVAFLDDSLQVPLGTPRPATLTGARVPRFVPVSVALSSRSFLAIAKASSMSVTFRGKSLRASTEVLSGFNALLRAMTCAQ